MKYLFSSHLYNNTYDLYVDISHNTFRVYDCSMECWYSHDMSYHSLIETGGYHYKMNRFYEFDYQYKLQQRKIINLHDQELVDTCSGMMIYHFYTNLLPILILELQ